MISATAGDLLLLLARWAHFAALALLFGGSLFFVGASKAGQAAIVEKCWRLMRFAAPVAGLSGFYWLAAIFVDMAGAPAALLEPESLSLFFLQTQFGPIVALRLLLLAALALTALSASPRFFTVLAVSFLLIADQSLLGHAAEGGFGAYGALMIAVYILHVCAAFAWIGALVPLWLILQAAPPGQAVAALDRFSLFGAAIVAAILGTGFGNVGFRVGDAFGALAHSEYGAALAVKAMLTAAMLALAAWNRFIGLPHLREKIDAGAPASLARSIATELLLGLCVLGAAAVLGITPPPQ